ncbi:MAG: cation diffusion facilitator family transporter [Mariprofundaceae bacterium]|nr:cation diffusion facilitator family transporter [Mariprofundaceae bacterium]
MSHDHVHQSYSGGSHLNAALALTALFAVVELVGGLISGSLALLADAGHMFSDVAALAIASIAAYIAGKPAHRGMTYGYGRAKIIAAQINGLALWFLAGWIAWEAVGRLTSPPEVDGSIMFIIALVGLVVNLVVLRILHGSDEHHSDINTSAAYWHVLGDTLGSVAAIVGGSVILLTGWMMIDPLLSFVVTGLLIWGGWRVIRQTTAEIMEAVPEHIRVEKIKESICQLSNVCDIHHIHVWKLPSGELAISAHVECEDISRWSNILAELQGCVLNFGITHATFQPEEGQCISVESTCH